MNTYADKLKDPRWQKKRLEIMQRDGFMCVWCYDESSTLHVHHLEYRNDPWDVPNSSLITLCEDCHTADHHDRERAEKSLLRQFRLKGFNSNDLYKFSRGLYEMQPFHIRDVMSSAIEHALCDPDIMGIIAQKYFEFISTRKTEIIDDLPF